MNHLNFSGGPGILPERVLAETQEAIACVPEVGLSLLGISHRSDWFAGVIAETEANIRQLLALPDDYAVLLLQGGATLQFSMIPMLLLRGTDKQADYIRSGYWSAKSIPPARLEGRVRVIWDGEPSRFRRLPSDAELDCAQDAAYLHYVSNETVEGVQFHRILGLDAVTRVCDMSSDFLSRPIDVERYDLVYAHAQKNLGPAGVTLVLSSHQMEDVAALAQGALVLSNGRSVVQDCLSCVFAQTDLLTNAGLAAPLAARLAVDLRAQGWDLNSNLITPLELVDGILATILPPARSAE